MTTIPYCDPVACPAAGCEPVVCVGLGVPSNDTLFARSEAVIPGGVNSSIRAFKAVGGRPYLVARAEGPYVFDVEGRRYIDLVQSYGAVILGHAHPAITSAIRAAAGEGTSYGAPTPREMKLAEEISARVGSCEQVRLMNSGTEATSTAVRLARGFTGRDRIVSFHGNFHGATDALLAAGGSGVATLGIPGTAGVPAGAVAETLVVPYNRVPELDETVAAVIVEPVAANMGVIAPQPGFLDGLRAECDRVGALLDLRRGDHRVPARSGRRPGQVRRRARPHDVRQGDRRRAADRRRRRPARRDGDAHAARHRVPRRHPGRQPARDGGRARRPRRADARRLHRAVGAGAAARGPAARRLFRRRLRRVVSRRRHARRHRRAATSLRRSTSTAPAAPTSAAYAAIFQAMLAEGVAMAPGAYEAIFVGLGHDDAVIEEIGAAAERAARTAAATVGTLN